MSDVLNAAEVQEMIDRVIDGRVDVLIQDVQALGRSHEALRKDRDAQKTGHAIMFRRAMKADAAVRAGGNAAAALRTVLDCKGPHEGLVSESGGRTAVCVKCEAIAREALETLEPDGEQTP